MPIASFAWWVAVRGAAVKGRPSIGPFVHAFRQQSWRSCFSNALITFPTGAVGFQEATGAMKGNGFGPKGNGFGEVRQQVWGDEESFCPRP
jgi:hypothetical protein